MRERPQPQALTPLMAVARRQPVTMPPPGGRAPARPGPLPEVTALAAVAAAVPPSGGQGAGRRRRLGALLLAGLTAVAAAGTQAAAAAKEGMAPPGVATPAALPTIGLDEVKVGQRGYGLSVFAGGKPERFDVEVVGVMRNIGPDTSYILARLSGHGLESIGVAAGMSGSPVFLDGRLAGAVAFGWPFLKEAMCGITPIATMRRLATLGGPLPVAPPPAIDLASIVGSKIPADLLARQLSRLRQSLGAAPAAPEGAMAGIEWMTSGFGDLSRGFLRQALGSVTPAGRAAAPASPKAPPPDLVPGSAVAAVLIEGDFELAATGTVTDHLGDRILAFGHPFLGLGPVHVPMAAADVITVLSSQQTSFKVANLGPTVGAFEQDRNAGIEGRLGAEAPMIPMVVRIGGAPRPDGPAPRQFHVRLADIPELLPMLAGSTLLSGLDSASYAGGPQSIDMTAHIRLAQVGDLTVHQSFDGESAGTAMAGHLVAVITYLMQNALQRVHVEDLQVDVEQSPQPMAAAVVAAHADHTVVHPGDRLGIEVELQAYRGQRFRRAFELRLPADLPLGRYSLLVGDGASADGARLALAPSEPATFAQAVALLRSLHSKRDLTLLGFFPGSGLAVAGEVLPRLPGSLRSLWTASASAGGAVALRSAIVQERHETLDVPLEGLLRIDLEVRRSDLPEPPPGDSEAVPALSGDEAALVVPAAAGRGSEGR